jgi:hypothetical protein
MLVSDQYHSTKGSYEMSDTDHTSGEEWWNDTDLALAVAVDGIEKKKDESRSEYHKVHALYHSNSYRKAGFSKRDIEDVMQRLTGKILGYEMSLTVLYTMVNERMRMEEPVVAPSEEESPFTVVGQMVYDAATDRIERANKVEEQIWEGRDGEGS